MNAIRDLDAVREIPDEQLDQISGGEDSNGSGGGFINKMKDLAQELGDLLKMIPPRIPDLPRPGEADRTGGLDGRDSPNGIKNRGKR